MVDIKKRQTVLPVTQKRKLYIVLAYAIGLTLLSLVYINNQTSIVTVATIGLTVIALIVLGVDYGVPLMIAAYQFTLWIPYIYVTLVILVFFLSKNMGRIPIYKPVLWYFLIAIFASASLTTEGASLDYYLRVTISQLAIVILFTTKTDENVALVSLKTYCLGFFLKVIVTFFVVMKFDCMEIVFQRRFGNDAILTLLPEAIRIDNENALATFAVLTIVFLCILCHIEKNKLFNQLIYCLGISLAIYLGLMTKSRTFIIAEGIFVLILFAIKRGNIGNVISSFLLYAFLIVGAYYAVLFFFPDLYDGVLSRFTMYDDITNGRRDIFAIINDRFFSGSVKGILFGYLAEKDYGIALGFEEAFHNVIQRTYVLYGFVGGAAFIGLLFSSLQFNIRKSNHSFDLIFLSPFIITLAAGMGSNPDLIIFLFCIYLIRLNYRSQAVVKQEINEVCTTNDTELFSYRANSSN